MVVEDEPVVRELIVGVLEDRGYNTVQAADGGTAARILRSAQPIDLIVTDVGLPVLNGRQVADTLAQRVGYILAGAGGR